MKRELADSMPGWESPAAHGVVLVPPSSSGTTEVQFPVVNVATHDLPALVLGVITGRRHETATYELDPVGLERAVAKLAPAEAAHMYQHPNIHAWRTILERWSAEPEARVFAVFIATLDDPISSPYDQALRNQIAAGERAELYPDRPANHRSVLPKLGHLITIDAVLPYRPTLRSSPKTRHQGYRAVARILWTGTAAFLARPGVAHRVVTAPFGPTHPPEHPA